MGVLRSVHRCLGVRRRENVYDWIPRKILNRIWRRQVVAIVCADDLCSKPGSALSKVCAQAVIYAAISAFRGKA